MREIRYSRVKKFGQKKMHLIIMFKIVAICYFLFITFNFASSYTGASFNKTVAITGFLAATIPEEDKSILLRFVDDKDKVIQSCGKVRISSVAQNEGDDLAEALHYEIYFIAQGDPMNGEKISQGKIPALKSKSQFQLAYNAEKPGNYKFNVLMNTNDDVWSKNIQVICKKNEQLDQPANDSDQNLNEDKAAQPSEHSKQEQKQLPVEEPIRENNGKENEVKKEQSNETLMKENENQENHSKDEMKENGAQQIEQNKTETKSNDIHLKEQQSAKQEQVSNALEQNEPPLQ
ncbi:amyloid fiber anchoring/assembly protein TapA [Aeribacillus composti]|uniref:amyloid fiber anchoring/assembly protein TapA n=1 Tax=Aeribacillus TaxID=1055323 RepID=UPI0011A2A55A|nr:MULTISPECIES: amyloid fiber anchoring/assembly protein TapA [Aeribacillus]MED1438493.1 amyloid fiber anchoring/assembly protein TapA [Aeribacillus composti]